MKLLLESEIEIFFNYLGILKQNYDDGGKSVVDLYSDCNYYYESFEEDTYSKMGDAAEHVSCKTVYYPNENRQINDECEPSYDIWFMSSRDMTEYYKTLKKLYKEKTRQTILKGICLLRRGRMPSLFSKMITRPNISLLIRILQSHI